MTAREFRHWLLAHQAHPVLSLILDLQDTWFRIRRPSPHWTSQKGPSIVLGDDSLTKILGKGRIDLDHGQFSNVLYVPGLASNLLSVYQMTHTGSPKKVIFSLDEVEITENSTSRFIAKGVVNHAQKVYMFSHFLPYSNPSALLIHANEARKIWPPKLQIYF